jgi:serine/threonine protein kinase
MGRDTEILCANLLRAGKPEDVFGDLGGVDVHARLDALKHRFKEFIRLVHPDQNPDLKDAARFVDRLVSFRKEAETYLNADTYGKSRKKAIDAILRSKTAAYLVLEEFRSGDVADLFLAENPARNRVVLKLTRKPSDNDLLENEAQVLAELHRATGEKAKVFQKYLPKLLDSFPMIENGVHRRANVLDLAAPAPEYVQKLMNKKGVPADPNYYSLAEIRTAFPDGIDARDVAWMIRRTFEGLGWVHSLHYVHGAMIPEHILVHPTEHGARLVGWSYARPSGFRLKAIPSTRQRMYPPEVFRKEPVKPVLDVKLVGACALLLLSDAKGVVRDDVPKEIVTFFERCRAGVSKDGWEAYREFNEILEKVYGKRRYRAFAMPPGT